MNKLKKYLHLFNAFNLAPLLINISAMFKRPSQQAQCNKLNPWSSLYLKIKFIIKKMFKKSILSLVYPWLKSFSIASSQFLTLIELPSLTKWNISSISSSCLNVSFFNLYLNRMHSNFMLENTFSAKTKINRPILIIIFTLK